MFPANLIILTFLALSSAVAPFVMGHVHPKFGYVTALEWLGYSLPASLLWAICLSYYLFVENERQRWWLLVTAPADLFWPIFLVYILVRGP